MWLERVPELIEACQDRWSLRVLEPFPQLSYHYVTRAVQSDGTQVVLKLGVPHRGFQMQVEALQAFDGCVKLLDANVDLGVVLLESVRPGDMLSDELDDSRAVSVAAGAGEAVVAAPASETWLPALWEWSAALRRMQELIGETAGFLSDALVKRAGCVTIGVGR